MSHRRKLYRNLIMFGTALSLWSVWLPMMRSLSGQNSYAWGMEYFNNVYRGVGWSGDYLFLIYQAILGVAILWMGFRNPAPPFRALLVIWHAIPFANALYFPLIANEENMLVGDTANIQIDLTWLSPAVLGVGLALVIAWVIYDRENAPNAEEMTWTSRNSMFAAVFAAYIVIVNVLEWTGATHGVTDLIAVPLNILAPILIALAFYPWRQNATRVVS